VCVKRVMEGGIRLSGGKENPGAAKGGAHD